MRPFAKFGQRAIEMVCDMTTTRMNRTRTKQPGAVWSTLVVILVAGACPSPTDAEPPPSMPADEKASAEPIPLPGEWLRLTGTDHVPPPDGPKRALALARRTARRHGVAARIEFVEGNTLLPVEGQADVIAANLPYVTTADWLATPPEIHEWEPRTALDGGVDGIRLGFDRRYASNGVDPALFVAVENALDTLARLGAQIVDVEMPEAPIQARVPLCPYEAVQAHGARLSTPEADAVQGS